MARDRNDPALTLSLLLGVWYCFVFSLPVISPTPQVWRTLGASGLAPISFVIGFGIGVVLLPATYPLLRTRKKTPCLITLGLGAPAITKGLELSSSWGFGSIVIGAAMTHTILCLVLVVLAPERPPPSREGQCTECGYNLTGLPGPVCPECGEPFLSETLS